MVEGSILEIEINEKKLQIELNNDTVSFSIFGDDNYIEIDSNSLLSIFFSKLMNDIISYNIFQSDDEIIDDRYIFKCLSEHNIELNLYYKKCCLYDHIIINNKTIEIENGNRLFRLYRDNDIISIRIIGDNTFNIPNSICDGDIYNLCFIHFVNDLKKYKDLLGLNCKDLSLVKVMKKNNGEMV